MFQVAKRRELQHLPSDIANRWSSAGDLAPADISNIIWATAALQHRASDPTLAVTCMLPPCHVSNSLGLNYHYRHRTTTGDTEKERERERGSSDITGVSASRRGRSQLAHSVQLQEILSGDPAESKSKHTNMALES